MSIQGVYYLLEDGRLVYQPAPPECVGAVRAWGIDVSDRYDFWLVAVEALALGVEPERICELMEKWGLTDEDARNLLGGAAWFWKGRATFGEPFGVPSLLCTTPARGRRSSMLWRHWSNLV